MSTLIGEDFLKKFSETYHGLVKLGYNDNPALKKISFGKDGEISRLNAYSAVLAANLLEKMKGVRYLSRFGLILGNEKSPNKYLVKELMKQVKERKYEFQDSVFVLRPSDLEIILDGKAPEKIAFKMKEGIIPFYSPQLKSENNKRKVKDLDENGMPNFNENGDKTLYVREGGLLKFCDSEHGDFYCWDDNLAKPDDNFKLVVFLD